MMKKMMTVLLILMFMSSYVFAGSNKQISQALRWWVGEQGQLEGAKITIKHQHGWYEITRWIVNEIPEPDEAQIDIILEDYEVYLEAQELAREARKEATLKKLDMTEQQFDDLREAIED